MRYLVAFALFFLLNMNTATAQKTSTDSSATPLLKDLGLSDEQLIAIKSLIADYKREERMKRAELRSRIIFLLNVHQQMTIRRNWQRWHSFVPVKH